MTTVPAFKVVLASGDDALVEQCKSIRQTVFVEEQGFPMELEFDDHDKASYPATAHFLMRLSESPYDPIGTIRMITVPSNRPPGATEHGRAAATASSSAPLYRLGRICILKPYRAFKLGSSLIKAGHEWVLTQLDNSTTEISSTAEVVLDAQIYAIGFYAKNGYVPVGEPFPEDGVPHQEMRTMLSRSDSTPEDQAVALEP